MKPNSTNSNNYRNVCDVIVPNDLCCGCGICAGVCPQEFSALRMEWNRFGEYIPVELSGRCKTCGSCLRACPFWNQDDNETTLADQKFGHLDKIKNDPIIGFYQDLFAGYSKVDKHRIQGAGGGLTTWLLEKLLSRGIVDRVCCVIPTNDREALFRFTLLESIDDVRRASRSAYYPVEFSKVIDQILSTEGRYAITGLPCALKGLRLAMRHHEKLRRRIIVLVGLVCGQQKSKFFAEYLCSLAGGQPFKLVSASFKVKDLARHHLDHRFEFTSGSNDDFMKGHIYQSEGMSWLWGHDCFKLNACNYCDDITAEVADVSFGDAVTEPYSYGPIGANFVIVRSDLVRDLLMSGFVEGELVLDRVLVEAVIERQKGVIILKRDDLQHRLYVLNKRNDVLYIPKKRFFPRRRINPFQNCDMATRDQIRLVSRNIYAEYRFQTKIVLHVERAICSLLEKFTYENRNWRFQLIFCFTSILESIRYPILSVVKRLQPFIRISWKDV